MATNYKQLYAIQQKNKARLLQVNPKLNDNSGIYFLHRVDENGIPYFYTGQAKHILQRMCSHLTGYQHIDLSLKKRGFYSETNPYGWKLDFKEYPESKLDEMEQYWILELTKRGYQCRYNKTSGSQGEGKEKINEFRPAKGYRDGIEQGYKNKSREIAHLFDKHLVVSTKNIPPTVNQQKALQKFNDFLEYYKEGADENGNS